MTRNPTTLEHSGLGELTACRGLGVTDPRVAEAGESDGRAAGGPRGREPQFSNLTGNMAGHAENSYETREGFPTQAACKGRAFQFLRLTFRAPSGSPSPSAGPEAQGGPQRGSETCLVEEGGRAGSGQRAVAVVLDTHTLEEGLQCSRLNPPLLWVWENRASEQ